MSAVENKETTQDKIDHNNNDNNNDNDIVKWGSYTNKLREHGFKGSCILDLCSGENICGTFEVQYNEYQEILKVLDGGNSIGLFIDRQRFHISHTDGLIIQGSNSDGNFILIRTNFKCIIGIFDTTLRNVIAEEIMIEISESIENTKKNEIFSNQVEE